MRITLDDGRELERHEHFAVQGACERCQFFSGVNPSRMSDCIAIGRKLGETRAELGCAGGEYWRLVPGDENLARHVAVMLERGSKT